MIAYLLHEMPEGCRSDFSEDWTADAALHEELHKAGAELIDKYVRGDGALRNAEAGLNRTYFLVTGGRKSSNSPGPCMGSSYRGAACWLPRSGFRLQCWRRVAMRSGKPRAGKALANYRVYVTTRQAGSPQKKM